MSTSNSHVNLSFTETEELKMARVAEIADREFALGDTLDVKTSIVLAVVVFLATQSDSFLSSQLSRHVVTLQHFSVAAQIFAGLFSVIALWPRDYGAEREVAKYEKWIDEVAQNHSKDENPDNAALRVIREKLAGRARQRADRYLTHNRQKSRFLGLAFYCTAAAIALNLATLVSRLY